MSSRSWLVPEVVQTSAMDCGPACLVAMLGGFGVRASYGRLREACQTDVDGTSIDTLEEIAGQLGLDAQQVLIPVDHVLLQEADALPAIAVTRLPDGSTHFVVIWRHTRGLVQVMDPGAGRRWISGRRLLDELYVHEMDLPADGWRDWAGSDDLRRPLARRLGALGVADPDRLIDRALADPGWRPIAALDAAARMIQAVVDTGGMKPGREAASVIDTLAADAADASGAAAIPAAYWSARPGGDDTVVRARGAVLVHVGGRREAPPPPSAELAAALTEPAPRPWRALRDAIATDGGWRLGGLAIAVVLAAAGTVAEALLFRGLFDLGRELTTFFQLLGAMIALVAFLVVLALVEVPLRAGVLRTGRHVEVRLRLGFLAKLPRLGAAYLRSRPASDMAERSHTLHHLRELPTLGARIARILLEIGFTAIALAWIAPGSRWLVVALVAAVVIPPFAIQPAVTERDLRLRTHAGGLARFYLDALLGVVPARTHGFERALRVQHESLLVEWVRTARARLRLDVGVAIVQAVASFGLAIALVVGFATRGDDPAGILLLAYWALALPLAGHDLSALLREVPAHRNTALRLLEPLGAIDQEPDPVDDGKRGAVAIEARGVGVVVAGHAILADVDLTIAPGEHVAIVGRSGAGKSTLLGLLLGWVRTAAGELRVDGAPATREAIAALRQRAAWVDPAVYLWNDTLAANLAYGAPGADLASVIGRADLEGVIARLPEGLGTKLGEGGGLLSSGEGQRIRFGRALARPSPGLVLLDEPFRGLDHDQRRARLEAARAHWHDATLLCVTHDIAETTAFPRVLVIEDGRIVEDGAPAELAARDGSRYAALLAEQTSAQASWATWRRLVLDAGRIR